MTTRPGPVSLGRRRAPVYTLPEPAVHAIGHAARYAAWRRKPLGCRPDLTGVDTERARGLVAAALAEGAGWQRHRPDHRSARLLRRGHPADRHGDRAGRRRRRGQPLGYPVVLKSADPTIVHKSDRGAVRLDLPDAFAVRDAYTGIAAALDDPEPAVLVQPMRHGGVEVVVGVVHDPLFGSLVMLGLGGVLTDLLGDRTFRLLPLTDLDAGRMWRSLRGAPLLTGFRGTPPVDVPALEDLLLRVGRLAEDLPEVAELDLNPVLALPHGTAVVDAKLRLAPPGEEPDATSRALREPPDR